MTALSIITATYNVGSVVKDLADSIAAQDFDDFEWIVQDGASTDDTLASLSSYDLPVSLDSRPDRGIYDALNRAVNRASGAYLLFIGADDVLASPTVLGDLARAVTALPCPPIALLGRCEFGTDAQLFTSSLSKRTWVINTVHHQGAVYRRDLFDTFAYDLDATVTADYGLTLQLLNRRDEVAYTSVLVTRCGAEGVSRTGGESNNYREMYRLRRGRLPVLLNVASLAAGLANVTRRRIAQ